MEQMSKYFNKEKGKKIQIKYEHKYSDDSNTNWIKEEKKIYTKKKHNLEKENIEIYQNEQLAKKLSTNVMQEEQRNYTARRLKVKKNELKKVNNEFRMKSIKIKREEAHNGREDHQKCSKGTRGTSVKRENYKVESDIMNNANTQNGDERELKQHFLHTYYKIKEMRKDIVAPVDKYGCHMLSEKTENEKVYRFQTLVSCMLSSRTKDEVTAVAMGRLKKHGLTVHNIVNTSEEKLKKLIYGVGFYNTKAKQLIQICHILKQKYNFDIPHTYEELIKLPGIGEKVAHLILQTALNKHEGIAVDIHVHRIANRLNWVNTKNEANTQIKLKNYVPKDLWSELNGLMVGFGQVICKAKNPLCGKCTLVDYCQYYKDSQNGSTPTRGGGGTGLPN
ncbi:endonuclease III homologue [Plasmodium gonderi]|uniref:Endonuclease III homolog n=1 Tax=Plasmodium gonderi TaxID=77519 RepID=A0A1Y1JKB4_PLAGO|nr:endonuclease III homologue [Plasmodium gonderi]GAW81875.1 endonuclease III homologue [Plasmodium gonderi]